MINYEKIYKTQQKQRNLSYKEREKSRTIALKKARKEKGGLKK